MRSKAFFEELISRQKRPLCWDVTLGSLSFINRMLLWIRSFLFHFGLLPIKKINIPVISVGNLTLGGTGKTPIIMLIASLLQQQGKHPLVASRGYGREDESSIELISDGKKSQVNYLKGGDEPVLISAKLPGVPVICGSDRYAAIQVARKTNPVDIVLLDDGFQHIRLKRDLDIVLVDVGAAFGNGRLFPAGILREPLSALRRAGLVIITKCESGGDIEHLRKQVAALTAAPVVTSRQIPMEIIEIKSGAKRPLQDLRGRTVLAVSGIARPASFLSMLRSCGAVIADTITFPDHHPYTAADVKDIHQKKESCRAEMVVTTEKDAVRLSELDVRDFWALAIEVEIIEQDMFQRVLNKAVQ